MRTKDFIKTMRNRMTVYFSADGMVTDYVGMLYTKTQCGNKNIIDLERNIKLLVSQYHNKEAYGWHFKDLWHRMITLVEHYNINPINETERKTFQEILDYVENVGYKIAFCCPKPFLKNKGNFIKVLENNAKYKMIWSINGVDDIYMSWKQYQMCLLTDESGDKTLMCTKTYDDFLNDLYGLTAHDEVIKEIEKIKKTRVNA